MLNRLSQLRLLAIIFLIISATVKAEVLKVEAIQIHGLNRISRSTVLSYLPLKLGDTIDSTYSSEIIRRLYATNFFSNVSLANQGSTLVISLVERATIVSITLNGNHAIAKKDLQNGFKSRGLVVGQEFSPAVLHEVKNAIIDSYYNMGLYDPKVKFEVKNEGAGRVAIVCTIKEGPVAKIKAIKIIGNRAFSERTLLKEFKLSKSKLWSFITGSDRYNQEKLEADLDRLRAYYMDHGYLKIQVTSTKISITPDRKQIYIYVHIDEGKTYKFGKIAVIGDLLDKGTELKQLIKLKTGMLFSRQQVLNLQNDIKLALGNYGYAWAVARTDFDVNDQSRIVNLTITVQPGRLAYIRYIEFSGNNRTKEEVLRREMRIQEGGLFSLAKLNESTRRLANLGYVKDIEHDVAVVPGSNNQVDLKYNIKEDTAISLKVQGGFSDRDGFLYGASIQDPNVFGSGKLASVQFDNSRSLQSYGFSYYDPYFTIHKLGFGVNGYFYKNNPSKVSGELNSYKSSTYGLNLVFDMPLSDYTQLGYGFGVEHIKMGDSVHNNPYMESFLNRHGKSFNEMKLTTNISYSKLDRALFPTEGVAHSLSLDLYLPFSKQGLIFYKADGVSTFYQPLFYGFILRLRGEVAYGDGLGNTKILPPFKNYFAGGLGTVRGFEADTLSDEENKDNVIGANLLTVATGSIIIPHKFDDTVRTSIFCDVGSVQNRTFEPKDLRASVGLQIEWRTPIAPLSFSFAKAVRKRPWDHEQVFQFSLSTSV